MPRPSKSTSTDIAGKGGNSYICQFDTLAGIKRRCGQMATRNVASGFKLCEMHNQRYIAGLEEEREARRRMCTYVPRVA